ncbi:UNVERIFIED_CONTAM: hypothetical protein Sangu_3229900 [Sesamum angustifolium]|uniref:Uncharacterized protein n=1 Tax=Sesamum angustifolium TaxID=2727405 RepID=A0AAW2JHG6_9LAMI
MRPRAVCPSEVKLELSFKSIARMIARTNFHSQTGSGKRWFEVRSRKEDRFEDRWSKKRGGPDSGAEPYDARVSRTVPSRRV